MGRHKNKVEKDVQRENEIKEELGCSFLRIKLWEDMTNGGLAAHSNSNIRDSIEVLSENAEMQTRTEGLSEISQGQRIESEKI